uniref:Small ribosomal subunit protein uS9m n=2 Tax=Latimeria chalumnae TaxID=7897 RepID=H3B142_LATCH
ETYDKSISIQNYQDRMRAKGMFSQETKQLNLTGSRWLIKEELEEMLVEKLSDHDFARFIQLMEQILTFPYCSIEEEYIHKFRRKLEVQSRKQNIEPLQYDDKGVAFSVGEGKRKTATANVILRDNGSGKVTVNGIDYLHYFPVLQDREQLMFPFQFLDRLGKYDMECTVSGGGRSGQAGAVRVAAARAVLSFITEREVEFMRQAGLLTRDPRKRERKKPGQEGARRKYTWKKR